MQCPRGPALSLAMAVWALTAAGCSGSTAPMPSATPAEVLADPCSMVTARVVGSVVGTAVSPDISGRTTSADRAGAVGDPFCEFSPINPTAVGAETPFGQALPGILGRIRITSLPAAEFQSACGIHGGPPPNTTTPFIQIPGAEAACLLVGPHLGIVFVRHAHLAFSVVVTRGFGADPALEESLAAALV